MGLQWIIGRSGANVTEYILDEIEEELMMNPTGEPIYYIVPDQMAFQVEYELIRNRRIKGSIRAQVLSLSRLAYYLFQQVGGGTKPFITSTGMQMMLRKIAEESKDSFSTFQKAMEKQGFIDRLEQMITEMKRYRISPEILQVTIDELEQQERLTANELALHAKLKDLLLIYGQMQERMSHLYVDSEDQLELFVEKIEETQFFKNATFYIDGFYRFTPQETYVLEALMRQVKTMNVALTIDDSMSSNEELDLFHQPRTTYEILNEIAEQAQIPVADPVRLYPDERRFASNRALQHLEKNMETNPVPVYEGQTPITFAEVVHPRAEVERVAQEIIRYVRDEGYRYRDMAILLRDQDTYNDLIETIFEDYEIPIFIDQKKSMLNHPLIELIRTGIEMIERNWPYDAIFRLLKTGFIPASDEEHPLDEQAIDFMENYVLQYGIRRKDQWTNDYPWKYERLSGINLRKQTTEEQQIEKKINAYRQQVLDAIESFDEQFRNSKTVQDKCVAIYEWMEHLGVGEQLEKLRDAYEADGKVETAKEQEQAWDALIHLLDEMVEMLGEDELSGNLFRQLVESGLDTLEFSQVPPSIDHVIIGDVERSRFRGVKIGFVLGVNEGQFPQKPAADGLVTDEEREMLEEVGMTLADRADRVLLDDRFYMYLAFTLPSDQLWVSYPLSDEEGKSKTPAQIIKRLKAMFPDAKTLWVLEDEDDEDPLRFIANPMKSRAVLTKELSKYLRGYPIAAGYWDTLHWYMDERDLTTKMILSSLFYTNLPTPLKPQTTEQLFDQTIRSSVSRLETYFQCSYHYFSQYTLGLQERKQFSLEAPDIGQLFHESLRLITEWVQRDGKALFELTQEDIERYTNEAITYLAPILNNQILFSSNRYRYILYKLKHVILRATNMLVYQSKQSDFKPVGIELGFGRGQKLPPLSLDLVNGYQLELNGRVDRVDSAEIDQELYLRIIDYKSSEKDMNLVDVYYGLSLQMLTYLDVVLTHSETWLGRKADPAGVFYFHVHNPVLKNPVSEEQMEQELMKKFRMNGLLLEDHRVAQAMDTTIESGTSQIAPFGIKKDGAFTKHSNILDQELFQRMNRFARSLMKEAGDEIVGGEVKLNPYEKDQQIACTYCPFKSVCQFDPKLEENDFRRLKKEKDEIILTKMGTKGGE